ncbi:ATPase [Rhodobacterales bacterium 52_120_T64]|nr:ATPase [Rhodobacterales bacterium 52_120_T64]
MAETSSIAACPACVAIPTDLIKSAGEAQSGQSRRIELSLPSIHCAACISGVETGLSKLPEIEGARVNLTRKRVTITVKDIPGIETYLIDLLTSWGYPAKELDSAALDQEVVDKAGRDLLARLAVAGFAMMNVMLLSFSVWGGAEGATREMMHWISAVIALPTVAFSGVPFFKNAWTSLRVGRLNMDVPISLALILASGVSLMETVEGGEHAYFDAALSLTFFLLLGRYLDHRTRAVARSAAVELAALEVHRAERINTDGTRETVPMDALREGDLISVAAGSRVPVDGVVSEGQSELDPSMLTGETMPEAVEPGTPVIAGMLNLTGALVVRAEGLGEDTLLQQITRLVESAEASKNKYTSLAEKAATIYAPLVHILSAVAFLFWGFYSGDWRLAVNIAAAVLIITCPCALGLAVPAVLTAASGRLFRNGVLLKEGIALERLAEVDTVVFDKGGTLTTGRPQLMNGSSVSVSDMRVAVGMARASVHPMSKAIGEFGAEMGITPAELIDIVEEPGMGTRALLDGQEVRLGRAVWCGVERHNVQQSASWLRIGAGAPVALLFEDTMRPEAAATITSLLADGVDVQILSGDVPKPVQDAAEKLGVKTWIAEATPADKVAVLNDLADNGHKVLMVGDGLNDAAALAGAYVSISLASAVDASRVSADLILVGDDLSQVSKSLRLARLAKRRILENFTIAAVYNLIAVPIALMGFATPLMAALAMSGSSITVSLNAMRLGRKS